MAEVKRLQGKLHRERRVYKETEAREVQHAVEEEERRRVWQMQWEKKLQQVREECEKQLADANVKKQDEFNGAMTKLGMLQEEQERREAEARQERIDTLSKKALRKIINQGLAIGFGAWLEMWEEKVHTMNMIKQAGNRLVRPAMSAAFCSWKDDWEEALAEAANVLHEHKAAMLEKERNAIAEELAQMKADYELKLAQAAEQQRTALERQKIELTGSAADMIALQEEKAKEERVELLQRQITRRIMNQDIIRGWSAWQEMYEAKTYAMNRLREVGNKLRAPELSEAFVFWAEECDAERQQAVLNGSQSELAKETEARKAVEEELQLVRQELAQKAKEADEKLRAELERLKIELTGSAAEKEAMLEEKAREERIELLRRQVGRRMMNQDIIRGWSAWQEMYEAKTYAMNRLREVGNKLRSPELSVAFSKWLDLWDAICQRNTMSEHQKQEAAIQADRDKLQKQMDQMQVDYEQKLSAAAAERLVALDRLRIELAGTAEERLALEESRAKEERIDLLRVKSGKRLMNAGILRGWTAWQEMWESKTYALGKLRRVAGRLLMREQSVAFATWVDLWEALHAAKERLAEREAQSVIESQLSQSRFEVGQLRMIKMANEDEIKALKDKHGLDAAAIEKKDEALGRLKPLCRDQKKKIEDLEEKLEATQEIMQMAEGERDKARQQAEEQFKANQELMERLLLDQRATFEEEKSITRQELEAATELQASIRTQYEKQLEEASDEHQALVRQARDEKEALETKLNDTAVQLRTMTGERDTLTSELTVAQENVATSTQTTAETKEELSKVRQSLSAAESEVKRLEAQISKMLAEVPKKKPPASATLGGLKLDPTGETTIAQQIAAALRSAAGRVLDLLREWDKDGDGEISRQEFHEAMIKMGLEAPKKDIDDLFSEWDSDGGGTLEFKELKEILAKSNRQNLASAKKPKK